MEVKINIVTKQYDENSNVDTISIEAEGKSYVKNNETYVVYKETEDGNETTTTIKISDVDVSIKRFGSSNSTMVFKNNEKNTTKYRTPQGLLLIETDTKNLTINNNENGHIKIDIRYNIKIMELFQGKNEISILIQNKE
ncbi:DUF1934 domain-containing protein [Romboutsia sp.]|uniref:DUF1934 domain-containing protein n=1 Tax=Romboutsia sp. TaxID=1965302 RepID=UPI003F360F63